MLQKLLVWTFIVLLFSNLPNRINFGLFLSFFLNCFYVYTPPPSILKSPKFSSFHSTRPHISEALPDRVFRTGMLGNGLKNTVRWNTGWKTPVEYLPRSRLILIIVCDELVDGVVVIQLSWEGPQKAVCTEL